MEDVTLAEPAGALPAFENDEWRSRGDDDVLRIPLVSEELTATKQAVV